MFNHIGLLTRFNQILVCSSSCNKGQWKKITLQQSLSDFWDRTKGASWYQFDRNWNLNVIKISFGSPSGTRKILSTTAFTNVLNEHRVRTPFYLLPIVTKAIQNRWFTDSYSAVCCGPARDLCLCETCLQFFPFVDSRVLLSSSLGTTEVQQWFMVFLLSITSLEERAQSMPNLLPLLWCPRNRDKPQKTIDDELLTLHSALYISADNNYEMSFVYALRTLWGEQ